MKPWLGPLNTNAAAATVAAIDDDAAAAAVSYCHFQFTLLGTVLVLLLLAILTSACD